MPKVAAKRRRSQRKTSSTSSPPKPAAASRRRRSTSSSSVSSISSSPGNPKSHPAPCGAEADSKPAAKQALEQKRSRRLPSAEDHSRKKRAKGDLQIDPQPGPSKQPRRSSRIQAMQVTPSPMHSGQEGKGAFVFATPAKKSSSLRFGWDRPLPQGVIDLYDPSSQRIENGCGLCGFHNDAIDDVTASYFMTYGRDFYQGMKRVEKPILSSPTASSRSSMASSHGTNLFHSPTSTTTKSFHTPPGGKLITTLDVSAITPILPVESRHSFPNQPDLTPKMRAILVDWIIELSEHFSFHNQTLHLAISLIDRVLSMGPLDYQDEGDDFVDFHEEDESKTNCLFISRERFQLLGATCTWMACKLCETHPPKCVDVAFVSDKLYTVTQIQRMERKICRALMFRLTEPTPFVFVHELLRASAECPDPRCSCSVHGPMVWMTHYLLELGRLSFGTTSVAPSLLAAAAVYLARVTLGVTSQDNSCCSMGYWTISLQHYSGFSKDELEGTVREIHTYHQSAEEHTLQSAYVKYKHPRYGRIALKTVPLGEDLGFS